jgi:hypothetical protein
MSMTTPRWHILCKQERRADVPKIGERNAANACFGDELIERSGSNCAAERAELCRFHRSPDFPGGCFSWD